LKITKTDKTKLDNYTNTASANDTSLRSVEQLGIQLNGLDTNAKKLKLDPKNGTLIANMVKYGKNWSSTKKLETTAIETMWNGTISDSEKAGKLGKEAVDKCAKYVSSSVLEKFNLLDDSLDKEKLKVVAGKLFPLAQAMRDNVGTLVSALKGEAELAALRVCAFSLDDECGKLSRKVEELKG
jgi:hypothetical protein